MRHLTPLLLSLCGCGLFGNEAPTPTPPEPAREATEAPAAGPTDAEMFARACDGSGPTDVQRDPVTDGGELITIACEWFAYQGTYELWLQADGAAPVHALSLLGVGGLDESTGQWTNLEKARGPGDCGVYQRFDVTSSAITLAETREQACGDGSEEPNIDPTTWPLVTAADPCSGGRDYFVCEVEGGKIARLCGAEDGSWLTYQFGPPGAPELVFPDDRSPSRFGAGHESWVRASADYVGFVNDGYHYFMMDKIGGGAFGEGEMNNFVGIIVEKDQEEVARIRCVDEALTQGLTQLQGQLANMPYTE